SSKAKTARGANQALLDLGFLEFDMLARDRIVLLQRQLLGLGARVLLGDVVVAGVGSAHQLDLQGGRLGHNSHPRVRSATDWRRSIGIRTGMSTKPGFPSGSWVYRGDSARRRAASASGPVRAARSGPARIP